MNQPDNPWGVTDLEAALMDALCETGSVVEAARALDISVGCASGRLATARIRMAGHKPHARLVTKVPSLPTIVACIRWARFTASQQGSQP